MGSQSHQHSIYKFTQKGVETNFGCKLQMLIVCVVVKITSTSYITRVTLNTEFNTLWFSPVFAKTINLTQTFLHKYWQNFTLLMGAVITF